jgi:hypothetical protein
MTALAGWFWRFACYYHLAINAQCRRRVFTMRIQSLSFCGLCRAAFLVLLAALALPALACFPVPMTVAQRAALADRIWVGDVTAIALTQWENELRQHNGTRTEPEKYRVRVLTRQQLKGGSKARDTLEFELDSCGGGSATLRDRVLVFTTDGFWYVMRYSDDAYQAIVATTPAK